MLLSLAWLPASAQSEHAGQAELDQMLAPIALYPDTVLSHVLIASTYPLEVVQAARWSRNHPNLKGQAAVDAVEGEDWDASVKALVAFPQLLAQMDEDLEWTQRLGDTFLAQEEQVVATVQALRERAYAEGNLESTEHVEVNREADHIIIEPAVREVVYVPWYDTRVVYGTWWWPAHPPVYWVYHDRWGRPYHYHSYAGFHWGSGIRVSSWFYFSTFHWPRRYIVVVDHHHHHYRSFDAGHRYAAYEKAPRWRHDPRHRRSVNYHNAEVRHRFEQRSRQPAQQHRLSLQVPHEGDLRDNQRWRNSHPSTHNRRIEPQRNDNWDRFIIRYPDARERLRGRDDIRPENDRQRDNRPFHRDGHDRRDRHTGGHRQDAPRDDRHRQDGGRRDYQRESHPDRDSGALVHGNVLRDKPQRLNHGNGGVGRDQNRGNELHRNQRPSEPRSPSRPQEPSGWSGAGAQRDGRGGETITRRF